MKKSIKLAFSIGLCLLTALLLFTVPAMAQDTTHAAADTAAKAAGAATGGILDWLKSNWFIVLPALYEFIVRIIPTATDWSWFNLLKNLIDFIIPNFSKNSASKTHV